MEREIDPELCDIDFDELEMERIPFSDGAYSKVYKAKYKDMVVCAKLIPKDMDPDDELFHLYVEREIQISRMLDHPNVVKHYGAGQDEKYFYILTEYVPGGNMRSFIKHHRGLAWDTKVHIAIGIAQGLQHMHSKNVLHRDIKSENFLVGDGWQIKICDFGLAKVINGDISKKAAHSICGTEEYMAPEMLMGLDYNDKVDIFSYGIFLAELFTQCYLPTDLVRTPATQFGLSDLVFRELLPPDCPLPLAELVLDCCSYVTTNRPTLERIIHKLHDIREVLPRFTTGNPSPQDPHQVHRRKSSKNMPEFKHEEIKITHFTVADFDDELETKEEEEANSTVVFEEIKFDELSDPDNMEVELEVFELQPTELQDYDDEELPEEEFEETDAGVEEELESKEDEIQEEEEGEEEDGEQGEEGDVQELSTIQLREDEFHEQDDLEEEELQAHDIREYPLEELTNEDWPQRYEIITTTTKAPREKEEEEEEEEEEVEYPEIQYSEFQVRVVEYEESKTEEQVTPTRPKLQRGRLGSGPRKPTLQHWESRELLENPLERELRLAREFVRARELPALATKPQPAEPVPERSELELELERSELESEPSELESELMDLDSELQMESFIVFEYPCEAEEREESNFNFAETFTSKSNKYSVYYH